MIKILAVGDVFGAPGCNFIKKHLRRIINAEGADLVIVNGENAATANRQIWQAAWLHPKAMLIGEVSVSERSAVRSLRLTVLTILIM